MIRDGERRQHLYGRYLIRHPLLRRGLMLIDRVLALFNRKGRANPSADVREILVANLSHAGDVVLTTAILPSVKARWPEAKIGFLVGSWNAQVIRSLPLVDRIHQVDHWRTNRSPRGGLRKFGRWLRTAWLSFLDLRAIKYDVAIDLDQYSPNAIPLLWAAGIPTRAGYASGGFGPLLTHPTNWRDVDSPVWVEHARVVASLGIPIIEPVRPSMPPPRGTSLPGGLIEPWVVVHPAAGNAAREWPADRWIAVIAGLIEMGMTVVVTGRGLRDAEYGRRFSAAFPQVLSLVDQLSWNEWLAVVAGARLMLSVDTVSNHVAAANGVPWVAIYSGIAHHAQWGPAQPGTLISSPVPCAPCFLTQGCAGMECIRDVHPPAVLAAARVYLAQRKPLEGA